MNESLDARLVFGIGLVIVLVALAFWAIAKAGSRLKGELGNRAGGGTAAGFLPPTLVKKALERGLVTPAQLARMTPIERQFLLATLRESLDEGHGPRG